MKTKLRLLVYIMVIFSFLSLTQYSKTNICRTVLGQLVLLQESSHARFQVGCMTVIAYCVSEMKSVTYSSAGVDVLVAEWTLPP